MERKLIYFVVLISLFACSKEALFSDVSRHDLWLLHKGAELPIIVEGNTNSKVFVILLHGGPGGTAQVYNTSTKAFTDVLEEHYAMVYYDQRNAGLARGEWDEEKLTIEQHVEDLDKVIDLLHYKFGTDIQIFLSGHSWGGYLGTVYLFDASRQAKIKSWINIDGFIHRNRRNKDNLEQMSVIANQQIDSGENLDQWTKLLQDIEVEVQRNILLYDAVTEGVVNRLKSRADQLIAQDDLLLYESNTSFSSLYSDNNDPFLMLVNDRKGTLIEQMYTFDSTVESSLSTITIPVLNIYGKYDVTTALQQGEYLKNNISTPQDSKELIILDRSGHSPMRNEPVLLASTIVDWIEKYK